MIDAELLKLGAHPRTRGAQQLLETGRLRGGLNPTDPGSTISQ